MSEVLYEQKLYSVRVGDELYFFSPGTTREQAVAAIEAARERVAALEEVVN